MYSWLTVDAPELPTTVIDSPSPNLKMHVKGAVPPVYVAVKVRTCFDAAAVGEIVKLVLVSGGIENVYVFECPG